MDNVWQKIKEEVQIESEMEPSLRYLFFDMVLRHPDMESSLCHCLANKLSGPFCNAFSLERLFHAALKSDGRIARFAQADLIAAKEKDPACSNYFVPFLYYKSFHALETHRIAHWLWSQRRIAAALYLQQRASELFAIDIHPAARLGSGIFLDHGTGFVAGETAVIEDNVLLFHEVTLGGTGKEKGDRHPKVREGAVIGAGAKILGNVEVGASARVGACSVVLDSVPAGCTAVGVPCKIISTSNRDAARQKACGNMA